MKKRKLPIKCNNCVKLRKALANAQEDLKAVTMDRDGYLEERNQLREALMGKQSE